MPGITEEWKHKLSEYELKYKMRIYNFGHKMETWRCGRVVYSQIFFIGESKFQLNVYPNGYCKDSQGNVSVFLENKNSWDVKVSWEFDCGGGYGSIRKVDDVTINSRLKNGWNEVELDLEDGNELDDGSLTLTASITLLWEEVVTTGLNLKSEVTDLKRKIETLETNMISKLEALENPAKRKAPLPCPECPICFSEMKPPTRIAQCSTGHLICQGCRDRPEVRAVRAAQCSVS